VTIDILFVNPSAAQKAYQGLANNYSAIEPPTWALLLAESVRIADFTPQILDINAERLTIDAAVDRIKEVSPRLICLVIYGQNPNSGTINMLGAVEIAIALKAVNMKVPICAVGSHISALPLEVLQTEPSFDFVLCNEGVYALRNVLAKDLSEVDCLESVNGIAYRSEGGELIINKPEHVVPQNKMDIDLPGYAWDLLPYKDKPLDIYRAHFWHAGYDQNCRSPFAAIYTSLGCTFQCDFCMINILNRDDNDEIGVASNYANMRFWSPDFIIEEFDRLVTMGVRTLRISDEMFLLNKKYYVPLCELLIERGYGKKLNMWAYSRVDTVRSRESLQLLKSAGINWLALGIESGDKKVRLEITKGKFEDVDIRSVVQMIEEADIDVIANYLFGLPGESQSSMMKTLDLGLELCTAAWNGYPVIPLPGSSLYKSARAAGQALPKYYSGYSFHGYETLPLETENLKPREILEFRDKAFITYHTYTPFLDKVKNRFGDVATKNIEKMLAVKLKRKLVEEHSDY
jgi:radical SAM superfamily enzyme YgiQ (UPF0313 family)